jgi:hypothetical protein
MKVLTQISRALGVIEAKIDETEETETGTEIEIAATGEIEESEENVEGLDRRTTARRAVKARSIPIHPAATTEQENEKTDTEAMAEETTGSGTVIEVIEARLEETSAEI